MHMYLTRRLAVFSIGSLLLFRALVPALYAEETTPFVGLSFVEAQASAAKDNKVVFVDFFTTWCQPCKQLDATTWKDAAVVALLREKTVALRIDAEKERPLAKSYRVEAYPTLLVLKADGTELDRYVGYMTAKEFTETLTATLAGKTSLQTAREAVKAEEAATPQARMMLGRKLAEAGQYEEALAQYLWCYDFGPDADPQFAGSVSSRLVAMIGALARKHPPALDALRARRDPLREKILADPTGAEITAVERLVAFDLAMRDDAGILSTLAALPAGGRARKAYGDRPVLMRLVEKKYYREALSLGVPEAAYDAQVRKTEEMIARLAGRGPSVTPDMTASLKKMPAVIGSVYVIALAGAGETERARALATKVMAQAGDPEVAKQMDTGLREAGLTQFADSLTPQAPSPTAAE